MSHGSVKLKKNFIFVYKKLLLKKVFFSFTFSSFFNLLSFFTSSYLNLLPLFFFILLIELGYLQKLLQVIILVYPCYFQKSTVILSSSCVFIFPYLYCLLHIFASSTYYMSNSMLGGKKIGTLQLKIKHAFFVVKWIPICCPMSIYFSNLNKE